MVFVISLTPLASLNLVGTGGLRNAILQVQQLYTVNENAKVNFSKVFSSTINVLHSAAGLNTVVTKNTKSPGSEQKQIVVSVRLPYLLPMAMPIVPAPFAEILSPIQSGIYYSSIYLAPDHPPPEIFPLLS